MANVLIRDLDEDVLKQLETAAKANGRSLQAEIHDVLRRASTGNLAEPRRLSTQWARTAAPFCPLGQCRAHTRGPGHPLSVFVVIPITCPIRIAVREIAVDSVVPATNVDVTRCGSLRTARRLRRH